MHTLTGTAAPVRLWTDPESVEPGALTQLRNCANLPWTHGVAVMPDVHQGYGATVGSVVAMRDAVSPGAVGVDIGCGMSAVRTGLTATDLPDSLARVRAQVERAVPVGRAGHREGPDLARLGLEHDYDWAGFWSGFERLHHLRDASWTSEDTLRAKAHQQLGSLGSGNHFLEVCLDGEDRVWLMLHSGSRGIGNILANLHIERAKQLPHNQDLPDRDLAVFLSGTPAMDAYRSDLYWAQEYARLNRYVMMELFQTALGHGLGRTVAFEPGVSCHHNYVSEETYDGVEPAGSSRWPTSRHRPRASSAARTPACSTRSPAPTRTSTR